MFYAYWTMCRIGGHNRFYTLEGGGMATARRVAQGKPLREALDRAAMSRAALARRIREVNGGAGPSYQLIAFLAGDGLSARETTTPETAVMIEDTLGSPRGSLFELIDDHQPDWADL